MTWQDALADELATGGVDVAVQVPDSRLDGVVRGLAVHGIRIRTLTREEECVRYAAGVRLGGGRPLALMQCSGLGNALNALGSLWFPVRSAADAASVARGVLRMAYEGGVAASIILEPELGGGPEHR